MVNHSDAVEIEGAVCPTPLSHHDRIVMGHGSGGKMSHDLIRKLFVSQFANEVLLVGDDSGVIGCNGYAKIAISTDAHVVSPLFFPGGDIGKLSICGTVNDVSMAGAAPLFIAASFILEEGLETRILSQVIQSMQAAAQEAGVQIVAGDTKVVQKGKADGLYITTTGIGGIPANVNISGHNAQPGDVVIISGSIGDHGIAVLQARGELGFSTDIQSDVAPLNHLVAEILSVSNNIHVLRDPTRGGVATTLNEIAAQSKVGIYIDEPSLVIKPAVAAACEVLGFDPLYIANEGKLIALVARQDAELVLTKMRSCRYGEAAFIAGEIKAAPHGRVLLRTALGSTRIIDMLAGEMLPRIC